MWVRENGCSKVSKGGKQHNERKKEKKKGKCYGTPMVSHCRLQCMHRGPASNK